MPKSKRAKVVHLTKVDKKGKELNQKLYAAVQESADSYAFIFVFAVENMRNNYLKDVRTAFADSKICFGKTKVMAKALGTTAEAEHLPGLAKLARHMKGDVGLLFTNREPSSVLEYFSSYSQIDYARAGAVATTTLTVPAGPVYSRGGEVPVEEDVLLPHSMEVQLRKWGMPTKLEKGRIVLNSDYTVCKEGEVLNSNQTSVLKQFGVALAEFRVRMIACWKASDGSVEVMNDDEMES